MRDAAAAAVRRVGLFGGTFDPVHDAHLAFARTALDALALDELRWVPSGRPWQKAGSRAISDAAHRAAMVALAIEGEPRFVLDRCEIDRPGPSYTVDTVRALRRQLPAGSRLVLLIGQDQYARLPTWHEWEALVGMVTLAVAARPEVRPEVRPETAPMPATAAADPRVRGLPFVAVPMPPSALSASDVRHRVRAGLDISRMVPAAVARYIETNRLYRAEEATPGPGSGHETHRS